MASVDNSPSRRASVRAFHLRHPRQPLAGVTRIASSPCRRPTRSMTRANIACAWAWLRAGLGGTGSGAMGNRRLGRSLNSRRISASAADEGFRRLRISMMWPQGLPLRLLCCVLQRLR